MDSMTVHLLNGCASKKETDTCLNGRRRGTRTLTATRSSGRGNQCNAHIVRTAATFAVAIHASTATNDAAVIGAAADAVVIAAVAIEPVKTRQGLLATQRAFVSECVVRDASGVFVRLLR